MSSVTLSASVKSNLLALQNISAQAATSQNILSTGKKVNSALDNATSFFTSQSLNSRASSLTNLLDSVSNGIQTIQAANTGITSISKLVDQLKSTGQQALATSSAYSSQAKASTTAVVGATAADVRGTGTTTYARNSATAGSAINATHSGTSAAITTASQLNELNTAITDGSTLNVNGTTITFKNGGSIGANDFDISNSSTSTVGDLLNKIDSIVGSASGTSTIASGAITLKTSLTQDLSVQSGGTGNALAALGLTGGRTQARTATTTGSLDTHALTFQVGSGSALTVTFGDPATTTGAVKSLDQLNAKLGTIGLTASVDSTGVLSFGTTSDTASKSFTVTSGDSATATTTGFLTTGSSSTAAVRGGAGADARDSLVSQFNSLLSQIDTLAKDSSYNGLNLLSGDTLTLVFNEKNTSKLSVTGSDASSTGLGLSSVASSDFNDGNGIQAVLSKLETSKTTLSSLSSKLGANLAVVQTRQDYTKNLANTLTTGADYLVNADLNEEATKLLALQTSQSLAQSALSLSNQSNSGVLRLLQ